MTLSGRTCQRWNDQHPHKKYVLNVKKIRRELCLISEMPIGDHNFCRQPEIDGERAWCYTMDPDERWEYCDVPECHEGI